MSLRATCWLSAMMPTLANTMFHRPCSRLARDPHAVYAAASSDV